MSSLTLYVLALAALASCLLLLHGRVYLPRRLQARYQDAFRTFSKAIELRFPSHRDLGDEVLALSMEVARNLSLSRRRRRSLALACPLRDIGLCATSYRLVNSKPMREWCDTDFRTYMRHAEVGGAMLENVPSLRKLAPIVRYHHADYDGGEEPFAPRADQIPIEARILCAVTETVWLQRHRSEELALQNLRQNAGRRFDAQVVEALERVLRSSGVGRPALAAVA